MFKLKSSSIHKQYQIEVTQNKLTKIIHNLINAFFKADGRLIFGTDFSSLWIQEVLIQFNSIYLKMITPFKISEG